MKMIKTKTLIATWIMALAVALVAGLLTGCEYKPSQEQKDQETAQSQQSQYAKAQPLPLYDWSMERDLLIKLYNLRNEKVSTHSVWRSDHGIIEGDCTSMGYGLPYDTSLTNPLQSQYKYARNGGSTSVAIGQAEPNGIFASTNTSATWVMCIGDSGNIEPVYVETKVTVYPYPVNIVHSENLVVRAGKATATIER